MTYQIAPSPADVARARLILLRADNDLLPRPVDEDVTVTDVAIPVLQASHTSYPEELFVEAFRFAIQELESEVGSCPSEKLADLSQKIIDLSKVRLPQTGWLDRANQVLLWGRLRRLNYLVTKKIARAQEEPKSTGEKVASFTKSFLATHYLQNTYILGSCALNLFINSRLDSDQAYSPFTVLKTTLIASSLIAGAASLFWTCKKDIDPFTKEPIDPQHLFHQSGKPCDAYSLLITLTQQKELRCPFTGKMLRNEQVKWLAHTLNIPVEDFRKIWQENDLLNEEVARLIKHSSEIVKNPKLVKDLKEDGNSAIDRMHSEARFKTLCKMLQSKNPGSQFAQNQMTFLTSRRFKISRLED